MLILIPCFSQDQHTASKAFERPPSPPPTSHLPPISPSPHLSLKSTVHTELSWVVRSHLSWSHRRLSMPTKHRQTAVPHVFSHLLLTCPMRNIVSKRPGCLVLTRELGRSLGEETCCTEISGVAVSGVLFMVGVREAWRANCGDPGPQVDRGWSSLVFCGSQY